MKIRRGVPTIGVNDPQLRAHKGDGNKREGKKTHNTEKQLENILFVRFLGCEVGKSRKEKGKGLKRGKTQGRGVKPVKAAPHSQAIGAPFLFGPGWSTNGFHQGQFGFPTMFGAKFFTLNNS